MKTALLFILMMLVLIAPHEFGHFIVAKLCGVQVNEFSVGMGPLLLKRKKGETQYSLRLIPIGGYCAMEGEDDSSDNPRAFNNKSPLKRAAILLAGVTMNVIIAIVACTIVYQSSGVPINKLASVDNNSPAYEAGLMAGDSITSVNGEKVRNWTDLTTKISAYDGNGPVTLMYNRGGEEFETSLTPSFNEERQTYTIGIVADVSKNPILCTGYGIRLTYELNREVLLSLKMIFTGQVHKDDVAGPVGLVKVVHQVGNVGAQPYIILLALVSLNLALLNLLPIPGLDGGKLLFVFLKWISRGRINDNMEFKASLAGILLLLGLFVIITINDISNLIH